MSLYLWLITSMGESEDPSLTQTLKVDRIGQLFVERKILIVYHASIFDVIHNFCDNRLTDMNHDEWINNNIMCDCYSDNVGSTSIKSFVVTLSLWPVQWCTLLTFGETKSKIGPAQVKTSGWNRIPWTYRKRVKLNQPNTKFKWCFFNKVSISIVIAYFDDKECAFLVEIQKDQGSVHWPWSLRSAHQAHNCRYLQLDYHHRNSAAESTGKGIC